MRVRLGELHSKSSLILILTLRGLPNNLTLDKTRCVPSPSSSQASQINFSLSSYTTESNVTTRFFSDAASTNHFVVRNHFSLGLRRSIQLWSTPRNSQGKF